MKSAKAAWKTKLEVFYQNVSADPLTKHYHPMGMDSKADRTRNRTGKEIFCESVFPGVSDVRGKGLSKNRAVWYNVEAALSKRSLALQSQESG